MKRYYSLLEGICWAALVVLGFFWVATAFYWTLHCVRGGLDSARGWLMHVALLGMPFEDRVPLQVMVRHIHAVYERLFLLMVITFLLYRGAKFLGRQTASVAGKVLPKAEEQKSAGPHPSDTKTGLRSNPI